MDTSARPATLVVRNDFDLVAPIYDALASLVFGGALRRAQFALLERVRDARRVLIIGGGSGWFLRELLARCNAQHVLYIEQSPKMLAYSRAAVAEAAPESLSRVEFRLGTEESLSAADGEFDLVATNFFLDLFEQSGAAGIARRLCERLAAHGRWLFVDFELPERGPVRLYGLLLFRVMFTFFNVVARMESRWPPDYARIFEPLGLRVTHERRFYASLVRARLLQRGAEGA
jgi:tRNA (cmo5U34)-methyltransferase